MLLFGLVLCTQLAWTQTTSSLNPILFVNETVSESAIDDGRVLEYNGYSYVLVQHPTLKIQSDFFGFQTLDYIPYDAAFARIPSNQLESAQLNLENAGGRLLKIKDAWRLSPPLFNQNYSEWAWADDEQSLILWMQYHRGLSHLNVLQTIQAAGIEVLEEKANDRLMQIVLDPEDMDLLLNFAFVEYVEEKEAPAVMDNEESRVSHRVNAIQQGNINGGIQYDGSGVTVAHNDAGLIGGHIDFKGRFTNLNGQSSNTDHGFHTAGTIFGAGNMDPREVGMAPGADLFYYDYPDALNQADALYTGINARITSNSFSNGCNSGYSTWSQALDKDAYDNPNMVHVFSSGNNGGSACGTAYVSGTGWGTITGGHKQGKNVITVGNNDKSDNLAGSSSKGPATDGRIKPDITAVGTSVRSTGGLPLNSANIYTTKTGTSMACPGVSGSVAVLMEAYKDHNNGTEPHGALIKGILMNGADDLGNVGPDFSFGYGRINVRRSYEIIENGWTATDSLGTGDSASFTFNIPANTAQAKFMLIWADRENSPSAGSALVNDLDLEVDYNNTTFLPWVLDPSHNVAAITSLPVRKRDSLNNIEQVTIDNPAAGTATITVHGYNVPVGGDQKFHLIAYYESTDLIITYPSQGMGLATGSTHRVSWDAPQNTTYTVEFSLDNKANWFTLGTTSNRFINWTMPNLPRNQVYLRVSSSFGSQEVGPMTIVQTPGTVNVLAACPDSVHLDWNNVPGASGYVVYKLGAKYMDSITYVDTSEAWVAHNPTETDWFSVAAVINDTSVGFRSFAYEKSPGLFNCIVPNDLQLEAVVAGVGDIPDCVSTTDSDLPIVLIRNTGSTPFTSVDVSFQRVGATAVVTETINRTINPGDTILHYFQSRLNLLTNVNLQYNFWIEAQGDGNKFNDSLTTGARKVISSAPLVTLPYRQDFESFQNCSTNDNCGATNCFLSDGWLNNQNGTSDQIDWRTNSGPTGSNATGPSTDYNPGTLNGKYLYLEASNDCDSAEAIVLTPCIDLANTYRPFATIAYNMYGLDMGTLAADVYDGRRWYLNVSPKLSGDQGFNWQVMSIDLSEFAGKQIVIRYRGKTGDGFRSDLALDDFAVVDSSGIGLNELLKNNFRIYPNPSKGRFVLSSNLPMSNDTQLKITDISGALVWSGPFKNTNQEGMELDLSDKAPGVYFVEISNAEIRETFKLIKE